MNDEGLAFERAVARFLAESRERKLTQAEEDCLWLYRGACLLHGQTTPDSSQLGATPAYKRGSELREALHGPVIPYHEDPHAQRSNLASLYFERRHGREPVAGDMLFQTDWELYHALELLEMARFIEAWQRQLPDLLCPLKIEDGRRVYRHVKIYRANLPLDHPGRQNALPSWTEWSEDEEHTQGRWWQMLSHSLNVEDSEMENIQAVTFLGVIDGEHRCRLATEAEIAKSCLLV